MESDSTTREFQGLCILYNSDCNNVFMKVKEPIEPHHVCQMVDEAADAGVNVFLANPNIQRVNYPSNVWQTLWDGYIPGDRNFFGSIPADQIPWREHMIVQNKRFTELGYDYIKIVLDRCRDKGIGPGISVRMNDMHDAASPDSHLFSQFYLANPRYHLSEGKKGWPVKALNYEYQEVREHYLKLIKELVEEYDLEFLELDFLRFTRYFPRGSTEKHCCIMTDFIHQVRDVCSKSGRHIRLVPRIAATPGAALELGFDVSSWAKEKVVDGITVGGFLNTNWHMPIDSFRELVGANIPIYITVEYTADRRENLPPRIMPVDAEYLRGVAAGYYAAGADGINLFNYFCTRQENPCREPNFSAIRDIKSVESLRGKSKKYLLTAGITDVLADEPNQVQKQIEHFQSREFRMFLASEPDCMKVHLVVAIKGEMSSKELWLNFNETPVGCAQRMCEDSYEKERFKLVFFDVPVNLLNDGENKWILRNESSNDILVISAEVQIKEIAGKDT